MAATSVVIANNALTACGTRRITSLSDTSKEARVCNDNYDLCRLACLRLHPWNFAASRAKLECVDISGAADSGSGEIRITATSHGFTTGNLVSIRDVMGTVEANGDQQTVTVIDANTFDIDDSTFTNTYVSGGKVALAPEFGFSFKFALPSDYIRRIEIKDSSDNELTKDEYRIENGYILTNFAEIRLKYVENVTDTTRFDPLFDEMLSMYLAADICYKLTGSEAQTESVKRDLKTVMQRARFVDSVDDPSQVLDADEWIRSRWATNQGYVRDPMT